MRTVCLECAQQACGLCTDDQCDCRQHDYNAHVAAAQRAYEMRLPGMPEEPDPYAQSELRLFDRAEVERRAIANVGHNAAPWVAAASQALRRVASRRDRVTSDDVWLELKRVGVPKPHDTRAIGAVMRIGIAEGYIHPEALSADTRPRVWRSLLYRT